METLKAKLKTTKDWVVDNRGKLAAGTATIVVGTIGMRALVGQHRMFTKFLADNDLLEKFYTQIHSVE